MHLVKFPLKTQNNLSSKPLKSTINTKKKFFYRLDEVLAYKNVCFNPNDVSHQLKPTKPVPCKHYTPDLHKT